LTNGNFSGVIQKLWNSGNVPYYCHILTKIEFLGWDKHTPEGFEKCKKLIESANVYPLDEEVANKAIELKRKVNIKLTDAVIGATALVNDLKLATRNVDDFEMLEELNLVNPFD